MAKFSMGEALRAAFGFIAPGLRTAWGVQAVYVAIAVGLAASSQPNPFVHNLNWLSAPGFVGQVLAMIAAHAAMLRQGLQDRQPGDASLRRGPGGLQWGAAEWRILAVTLLLTSPLALIWALMNLHLPGKSAPISVSTTIDDRVTVYPGNSDPRVAAALAEVAVTGVILLVAVCFVCWLAGRLSGLTPSIVEKRRISVPMAWRLTRGGDLALSAAFAIFGFLDLLANALAHLAIIAPFTFAGDGGLASVVAALVASSIAAALFPGFVGLELYAYRQAVPAPNLDEVFS